MSGSNALSLGLFLAFGLAIVIALLWVRSRSNASTSGPSAEVAARWAKEEAEDREFYATAKRYPATVISSSHWGELNLRPLLELRLRIDTPDGPYEASVQYNPQPQNAHLYGEGGKIHVYVDPMNRERLRCSAWESSEDDDESSA